MTWSRPSVAAALVDMITAATAGITADGENSVYVHPSPPDTLNPFAVVVMRPNVVTYSVAAFGIDQVELPVAIVGGIDSENAVDDLKNVVRHTIGADQTLKGTVVAAWCTEERNWRNVTGAGGIQLLYVELILNITQ
jgi:hypothetical protein